MSASSSVFSGVSASYLEALEARYRADPGSVDLSWRCVFDVLREIEVAAPSPAAIAVEAAAAFRSRGHLAADLDPLSLAQSRNHPELDVGAIVRSVVETRTHAPMIGGNQTVADWFRSRYCGTLTVESAHVDDAALRAWIHRVFEGPDYAPSDTARRRALRLLVMAEAFERFLATKLPTKKRFGAEGSEALVPLLDRVLTAACQVGVTEVVVGTMHRGRLNLMANVLGKPLVELLAQFKGIHPFSGMPEVTADVPYHLGLESELTIDGRRLVLSLSANPSHLEAVNPVVLGRIRARQDRSGCHRQVLGILIHTDASVIGQGVVAETLQLSGLPGFATAGTIHLIVDNQIGFTTERHEARTSRYCTGVWKAIDSLILHVNGDDVDNVLRSADMAVAFRQEHGRDAVVNLRCYRRNGHNEIDEPRFTQPRLYMAIDDHPSVARLHAERLHAASIVSAGEVSEWAVFAHDQLQASFDAAEAHKTNKSGFPDGLWAGFDVRSAATDEPATGVSIERLQAILASLSEIPPDMTIDRKLERIVRRRAQDAEMGVAWPMAEALALGTLLTEGVRVRLSGQDVVRGAFSQRHFALTDVDTGHRHVSLNHLDREQAKFDVVNSPLSEYAVLAFEYGYSLERPDMLVVWEAQFGDFANGAQITIDQFIASGEEKWRQPSGLVMLLPHGLEGQGPEHSSARPERFLQLASHDNMIIAHPSTPASYFHLLRRQVHGRPRKPLIIFGPKSLLRHPAAISPLEAFGPSTRFHPVIITPSGPSATIILLCSGKIAYELERERESRGLHDVAIVRLEQLYPFPEGALREIFMGRPHANVAWVQEEPQNMGAWGFLDRRLEALFLQVGLHTPRVTCLSRLESPSPPGSFHGDHERDQRLLVERTFDWIAEQVRGQCQV